MSGIIFTRGCAEIVNAIILYFVMLIPTDSAAMRLSRIAITARPDLELTKLRTITSATIIRTKPAVKEAMVCVPVAPCAPLIIAVPVGVRPRSSTAFAPL